MSRHPYLELLVICTALPIYHRPLSAAAAAAAAPQIHSALSASLQQFKHGPGDVEDACWQLLCELQLLLATPEDRLFVARLLEPVAEWCPISTPGAPFSKVRC